MPTSDSASFDKGTIRLLSKITEVYGSYSAASLRDMTHQEDPWKNTQDGQEISWPDMKHYFQEQPDIYERFATFTPEEVRELARTPELIEAIRAGMEDRRAGRMIPLEEIRGRTRHLVEPPSIRSSLLLFPEFVGDSQGSCYWFNCKGFGRSMASRQSPRFTPQA